MNFIFEAFFHDNVEFRFLHDADELPSVVLEVVPVDGQRQRRALGYCGTAPVMVVLVNLPGEHRKLGGHRRRWWLAKWLKLWLRAAIVVLKPPDVGLELTEAHDNGLGACMVAVRAPWLPSSPCGWCGELRPLTGTLRVDTPSVA